MDLEILRFDTREAATIGALFEVSDDLRFRTFLCFTLEDAWREQKVYGKTRIPSGRYQLTLRTEGAMNQKYAYRFSEIHKGMIWIRDIPNFKYCYIHIGNTDVDTLGCPLVGYIAQHDPPKVIQSTRAYKTIYPRIAKAIEENDEVWLRVLDFDTSNLHT